MIFDAANDGTHIILGMLIVGLIFLGAIGIGELTRAAGHRRKARKPGSMLGNHQSPRLLRRRLPRRPAGAARHPRLRS